MAERSKALDAVDRRLLALLQADGRMSNAALAREVGLTPSAVLERVRRLEADGYVLGYRATLDPERLGYGLTVLVSISLDHHDRDSVHAFADAIAAIPEVVECAYVTGTADFRLRIRARDVADYRRLLETTISALPRLRHVESSVVLEVLKDDPGVDVGA